MTNCSSSNPPIDLNCSGDNSREDDVQLRPCCVCPETRKARDECVLRHGPDSSLCKKVIEAHNVCLASYGFKMQ